MTTQTNRLRDTAPGQIHALTLRDLSAPLIPQACCVQLCRGTLTSAVILYPEYSEIGSRIPDGISNLQKRAQIPDTGRVSGLGDLLVQF